MTATDDAALARTVAMTYGHRVHVTSRDDETSTTYVESDATLTTDVSAQPIRVRRGGTLLPVDTTPEKRADGTIGARAATAEVSLGGGGSSMLARQLYAVDT